MNKFILNLLNLAKRTVKPVNNKDYSWEIVELKPQNIIEPTEWTLEQGPTTVVDYINGRVYELPKEEKKGS